VASSAVDDHDANRVAEDWAPGFQITRHEVCMRGRLPVELGCIVGKAALILLALSVAAICTFVAVVAFQSPRCPNVSLAFLGYTNDSTGSRLARFLVTNHDNSGISQWTAFLVIKTPAGLESVPGGSFGFKVQAPAGWMPQSKSFLPGNRVLGPGASEVVGFLPPTNQPLWRIHLRVHPDVGAILDIKGKVAHAMWRIGLRPRYQEMLYGIDSNWIEGER
jgi:hypothetical protein